MKLFSPAKLNLFLRVLHKRSDGYHDLATLMQSINFCDIVTITQAEEDAFLTDHPFLAMDGSNLVLKALQLFRSKTGIDAPVRIHLEKNIPMEAGLGGGSSNAATVLWGLNRLFQTNFSDQELMHLSKEIGSDIPFFFSHGRALCRGRGEIVENIAPVHETYTLYKYEKGASTAAIFRSCIPRPETAGEISNLVEGHQSNKGVFVNDLQAVTEGLLPGIDVWKGHLPPDVVMTGSGSAYFTRKTLLDGVWNGSVMYRKEGEWYTTPQSSGSTDLS